MKYFSTCIICVFLEITTASYAQASSVASTSVTVSQEQSTPVKNTMIGSAQDWSLSEREWGDYQKLMQGPAGKWYPQLTPTEVLGMFADNAQDQQYFAEMAAKEQHDKIAREVAFNNTFHQAMHRLYTDEPVIKLFDMSAFNPIQRNNTESGSPIGSFSSFH